MCLSMSLSVHLSVPISVLAFVCPNLFLFIYFFISLSVHLVSIFLCCTEKVGIAERKVIESKADPTICIKHFFILLGLTRVLSKHCC